MTVLLGHLPPRFHETIFFKDSYYEGWPFHTVLECSVVLNVEDTLIALGDGDSHSCHSTQLRWVRNETETMARMLAVLVPGAM